MHRRLAIAVLSAFAAWLGLARLAVPALIRRAYRGESFGFLNGLITGQNAHPVQYYLDAWAGASGRLTIGIAVLLGAAYLTGVLGIPRRIGRWSRGFAEREASLKDNPPTVTPADYLVLVVCCGLAAGVWEALYISKKILLNEWLPIHMATGATAVWMAPLSYLAVFGLLGMIAYAAARLRPRWLSIKWVLFAAAMLAYFSIFRSMSSRLELYGAIPLAAGLALVTARLVSAYSEAVLRFARRSIAAVLILAFLAAAGIRGKHAFDERRELARLPEPAAGQPNVLLLILDTVRSKSLSLYGYDRSTAPNLERLAEQGVVFDRAVATSPWTLPTHASVFTGRYHHELSVNWTKPLDSTFPTLAEVLRDRGYATAGFVGNFYYGGPQFGLDRGFIRYRHKPITVGAVLSSGWLGRELLMAARTAAGNHQHIVRKTAADVNREFLDWQAASDPDRPFFAFLNYYDAHSPYLPPEPYDERFGNRPRYWLKDEGAEYTPEELSDLTDAYDNSIAYLDDQLGLLFAELASRGILENTLLIVAADHGEQFGEHLLMFHSNSLYIPLLHVPLLMSFPGRIPGGVRITEPVSLRDVAATVMEVTGIDDSPLPGTSIAAMWREESDSADIYQPVVLSEITVNRRIPDWLPAAYGPMQSLIEGRLHYIRRGDGVEELYDWIGDPDELDDLAGTDAMRQELERMRTRVDGLLQPSAVSASANDPSAGEPPSSRVSSADGSSSR